MIHTCRHCSRINPADARYCYYDGIALTNGHGEPAGPLQVSAQAFPNPIVLPSGQVCQNFDQLALACWKDWKGAIEALKEGDLANFLSGIGRADLAKAAREAARAVDPVQGLNDFLGKLPGNALAAPKLAVEPTELSLGVLKIGENRKGQLRLVNQGMRLVTGRIFCENCLWLSLGDASGVQEKVFHFGSDMDLPLFVRGNLLAANSKPIEGRLIVESNGGRAVVSIRVEVPVKPFAAGVAAGALTVRQFAEKAKKQPREVAPLFENGSVARWYKENGWAYPVQGPTTSGLGAIQQYFEALGLAKPPRVEISQTQLVLTGKPGETLRHQLEVRTRERKFVYALAASNEPWLHVECPPMSSQTAPILLSLTVPDHASEPLEARVAVRANGAQRFVVLVKVEIAGARRAAAPMPVAELIPPAPLRAATLPMPPGFASAPPTLARAPTLPRPAAATLPMPAGFATPSLTAATLAPAPVAASPSPSIAGPKRSGVGPWIHLLPAGLLLMVLFFMFGRDLLVKGLPLTDPAFIEDTAPLDPRPYLAVRFHRSADKLFPSGGTMRFGLMMPQSDELQEKDFITEKMVRRKKRLTFAEEGHTNNTVVKLDRRDYVFGDPPGRWQEREAPLGKNALGQERDGLKSSWLYPDQKVLVTQSVEIVRGPSSRLLDTALVRYRIENQDDRPHAVGLRFMLDTLIGRNDGVPFTIPSLKDKPLCDTMHEFNTPEQVPDFIQALEIGDLSNPGTVAHLQFRVGGGLEVPQRVTLGAWPNPLLRSNPRDMRFNAYLTGWEVPVVPIKEVTRIDERNQPDSCVVMYWEERDLGPGKSREMGFTYGLKSVSSAQGGSKLAVTVSEPITAGTTFTVTAYVNEPAADQKLTLQVPAGLTIVGGEATQRVPAVAADSSRRMSIVTWKVEAPRIGKYTLKVESSTGISVPRDIRVTGNIFE
ncbi:MAG: hypothetical protein K2R98_32250 [Gemmataceae bacterium]|nr:hypothetical protein [Gemmataceae bacterium]